VREVEELCQLASKRLRKWADVVHDAMKETDDLDRIAELLTARTASEFEDIPPGVGGIDRYEVLSSMKMNAAGLVRYWQKREAAGSVASEADGDRPR
jgi:hypothetical protein